MVKFLIYLFIGNFAIAPFSHGTIKGARILDIPGWSKSDPYAIEPLITAPSAIIIDAASGQILYKKNHTTVRPVASITKLMTAYLYLKKTNFDLERFITIADSDERDGGKRYVYRGEIVTSWDLLNILLIGSDNNIAATLARAGGFDESFREESKKILETFGLSSTSFSEPTGLSLEDSSTALEVAKFAKEIFEIDEIRSILHKERHEFTPINASHARVVLTTNELLKTELFDIVAGKTGFTNDAGYCLVLKAVNKHGKGIIIAVLGASSSEDRFQDAKALTWWIFENFE